MSETALRNVGNSLADLWTSRMGVVVIHWTGTPCCRQLNAAEYNPSITWRMV
ncbi:hypothetical protein [Glaciimonas sp. PCH181]|uniref:hypothetical protein n=1 Tax=Glaciimonas sp. PCH181 TaxID=2133943 RepID=UPI001374FAC6|nr:hypothetical protein [Glaciimonas sp. PCH181]